MQKAINNQFEGCNGLGTSGVVECDESGEGRKDTKR